MNFYLQSVTPASHAVLQEMEHYAEQQRFPIIGPLVGRFLAQYAKMLKPIRILELGSGFGYSALWWALSTPIDTRIFCTDGDAENKTRAQDYLTRAGVWDKITFHVGDAVASTAKIPGTFDIILMDIDKEGYPAAFQKLWPRLRAGGLFITDNVLWSGRVAEPNPDVTTMAIQEFTRLAYATPGALTTIIPVRDGVSITYKEHP